MFFSPHTLQVKATAERERDEFGRVTKEAHSGWRTLGKCRCDDVSAERRASANGALYDFKYKVVFGKGLGYVAENSDVRCLNTDGTVRGQGIVKGPMETNYLGYRVVWLE